MTRLKSNFKWGTITVDLSASGSSSTMTSPGLSTLPTVTAPDIAVLVLDPNGVHGAPEVVHITAHTVTTTTATILRAQEGTTQRAHLAVDAEEWRHVATAADWAIPAPDATTSSKGIVQIAGDLGGPATAIFVKGLLGPTHYNVMSHASYDPIAADNHVAIQGTINLGPGTIKLPPGCNGKTASTITVPSNVTFEGSYGGATDWALGDLNGSNLVWTGATGGTVLLVQGQHSKVRSISIDGSAIANVTGILVQSNNTPATWYVSIDDFYIQRCGSGDGSSSSNGYGIRWCSSVVSGFQADKGRIGFGEIRGSYYGISVESDNALDGGIIDTVNPVNCYYGINIEACGEMAIKRCIQGGNSHALVRFGNRWNPVLIESCQAEGYETGSRSVLIDGGPIDNQPITLMSNVFAHSDSAGYVVEALAQCVIVSIGNQYFRPCRMNAVGGIVEHVGDRFNTGSWVSGMTGAIVGPPGIKDVRTASWTPGLITAGANASTYVTVAGNQGDYCRATFTGAVDDLELTTMIVATNVAKVYATNKSGSSITPTTGTVTVQVFTL